MKKKVDLYGLPHCTTCQKAVAFLEEAGVEIGLFHDLKADMLSRKDVEGLVEMVGGAETLFSKRAMKYRSMKLNERTLTEKEMTDLMVDEYTFIKRPVITDGKMAIAGFAKKRVEEFLNG